ncbi:MAG: GntG family PLP-dependent aldolase [Lysobacterales bacterium]|jgi:threonine aldolase
MLKVDLRSDTFTLPDSGMRKAIFEAEVGNSGYGEDPSVTQLETEVARYFGAQAAIFLPSATMAGQVAIHVWCDPGDVVLIEEYGHNYYFETGSMALISGAQARPLKGVGGILSARTLDAAIVHPENPHARTALMVLENTSNFGGGRVYPLATLERIFALGDERGLPVHVDGARIWNAIVASGSDPAALMPPRGSMSVCFSKGLGAPMGALLLGTSDFIAEARRVQCMLGGVMRQVGFMAAAALYGFRNNLERLAEDHANCRFMAEQLAGHPALELDPDSVETNILYFTVKAGAARAASLIEALSAAGVAALHLGPLVRLVTSLNVTRGDCEYAVDAIRSTLK